PTLLRSSAARPPPILAPAGALTPRAAERACGGSGRALRGRILTGWFSSRTDRPHSAPRSSRTERRASSCLSTEPSVRGALFTVIIAKDIELRAGPRLLIESATFRVNPGDRVGFVGRNGAGKTTLTKVLAGEALPAAGAVTSSGTVGYLPQDPRDVDLEETARDRILSARGLDEVLRDRRAAEEAIAAATGADRDRAVRRYGRLEERLHVLGGYAAEAEAASMASSLGLPDRVMNQPLGTLSGGQRRRVELARILFSGADTLLLDEPTNHLDADSIVWLRDFLKGHQGGLVVISHDVELLDAVVNRVFHLDANRCVIDIYNVGWKKYLE